MARRPVNPRNPQLEATVRASPNELAPRLVYCDWLQSTGDVRGEWGALQAGLPAGGRTLHDAALDFLASHRDDLLGELGAHLDCLWIGWFGGFIDELRFHGRPALRRRPTERMLERLLTDPICAFLRGFSLGGFERGESKGPDALLEVVAKVAPSMTMLERLVLFDSMSRVKVKKRGLLERVASRFRALKTFGLAAVEFEHVDWSRLPPTLETLNIANASDFNHPTVDLSSLVGPSLKELCLASVEVRGLSALATLPSLKRLRLVHVPSVANAVRELRSSGVLQRLEFLDVSHSEASPVLREAGELAERLRGVRMSGKPRAERPQLKFAKLNESPFEASPQYGPTWLTTRLTEEGREALSAVPLAGLGLYNESCYALMAKQHEVGLVAAQACVTLPHREVEHAWDNVGVALGELHRFSDAELSARHGLLRIPGRANLYSNLTDALRCQGKLAEAVALLPVMLKTMKPGVRSEELQAALLDVILILDQAGDGVQALKLAKALSFIERDERIDAALWLVQPGKGRPKWLKNAKRSAHGVVLHAAAVHALREGSKTQALSLLERARDMRYHDLHFLPRDERLVALHQHPRFTALCTS